MRKSISFVGHKEDKQRLDSAWNLLFAIKFVLYLRRSLLNGAQLMQDNTPGYDCNSDKVRYGYSSHDCILVRNKKPFPRSLSY